MTRRLRTNIFETGQLVVCLWPVVVSTYAKWTNDGWTSVGAIALDTRALSSTKDVGDCPVWWCKIGGRQWLHWQSSTMQIEVELFQSIQFSGHHCIWDYAVDVQLLCHCRPSIIDNYAYTGPVNIVTRPWISGRELPGQMNHNSSFIK